MNASELRILCTALGFTALASKEGGTVNAGRAKALALLIEEFCRSNENVEQGPAHISAHTIWSSTARDGFIGLEA